MLLAWPILIKVESLLVGVPCKQTHNTYNVCLDCCITDLIEHCMTLNNPLKPYCWAIRGYFSGQS